MNTIKSIAVVATILGLATAATAEKHDGGISKELTTAGSGLQREVQGSFNLICKVQGTPIDFPNDVVLLNEGLGPVPKGTVVQWAIDKQQSQGSYTFNAALGHKQGVTLLDVLPFNIEAGTPCRIVLP